jgi:hypothetical protein
MKKSLLLSRLVALAAVFCPLFVVPSVATEQIQSPPASGSEPKRLFFDLRAPEWHSTRVVNTTSGVVQHTGDDIFPDGTVGFLRERLSSVLPTDSGIEVQLKTSDIRIYLPNVKVDENALRATQNSVRSGGYLAAPIVYLLESFSRNKSASAVFCVAVGGKDYLGNDARLFRAGAEGELKASIDAAVKILAANIASGKPTTSPACEPGWEGGQPARQ